MINDKAICLVQLESAIFLVMGHGDYLVQTALQIAVRVLEAEIDTLIPYEPKVIAFSLVFPF